MGRHVVLCLFKELSTVLELILVKSLVWLCFPREIHQTAQNVEISTIFILKKLNILIQQGYIELIK